MPSENSENKALLARTEGYAEQVRKMFAETANEIIALHKKIPAISDGEMYSFDGDTKKIQREVSDILNRLHAASTAAIKNGIQVEWKAATKGVDDLLKTKFGKEIANHPKFAPNSERHNAAINAFINRRENSLTLSDRIWKSTQQFREEMEIAITVGIGSGKSAAEISRDIRHCLNNPDDMFRRFRYKFGEKEEKKSDGTVVIKDVYKTKWKKKVKDKDGNVKFIDYDKDSYKVGAGMYKSAAKNAMRVARTETNMAYRNADYERWQELDFVIGIKISPSHEHPKKDICDELAGEYPKDFRFEGWHPQCFCKCVPILAPAEQLDDELDALLEEKEGTVAPPKQLVEMPKQFNEWVEKNLDKISNPNYKQPYFVRHNIEDINWIKSEKNGEDYFRRLREASQRLSDREVRAFHDGSTTLSDKRLERIGRGLARRLERERGGDGDTTWLVKNKYGQDEKIIKVGGDAFYDCFEQAHKYLMRGDQVELHGRDFYKNGFAIMRADGTAGFFITNSGDAVSGFSLSTDCRGKGFFKSIAPIMKQYAKTGDCFQSVKQDLPTFYKKTFGWQSAAVLEFNYDIIASDKGKAYADWFVKTYGKAPVHFMVNVDHKIETKFFNKDQYDEAVAYQQACLKPPASFKPKNALEIASARHAARTPEQVKDIQKRWDERNAAMQNVAKNPDDMSLTELIAEMKKGGDKAGMYAKLVAERRKEIFAAAKKRHKKRAKDRAKTIQVEWDTRRYKNTYPDLYENIPAHKFTITRAIKEIEQILSEYNYDEAIIRAQSMTGQNKKIGLRIAQTRPKTASNANTANATNKPKDTISIANFTPKSKYQPDERDKSKYMALLEEVKKVKSLEVKKLEKELTTQAIIERLQGGDMTKGSCSSLAIAYAANKAGYDVLDFRGGDSWKFFSSSVNICKFVKMAGGLAITERVTKKRLWSVLDTVENGKEYYFAYGRHAAIIKRDGSMIKFLEMQSKHKYENGFDILTPDQIHSRFDAKNNVSPDLYLVDIKLLVEIPGFQTLISRINTSPDKQLKGGKGGKK